jgi:hypothetical protein
VLAAALVPAGADGAGAQLVRGPYLQRAASEGIVVRWRTDIVSDGVVRFGASPDQLDQHQDAAAPATDHEVELTGLAADTLYFYSVGTADEILAGGDPAHRFRTSPPVGEARETRVWVLGDSGTGDAAARAVRDGFFAFTGGRAPDLWLMLGDNAYFDGTDAQYQQAVFDVYPAVLRSVVLWPTFGNHDAHSADSATESGPYFDIFTLPRNGEAGGLPSATEAYYSFDHANLHLVCLDSAEGDLAPDGPMLSWLADDLAAAQGDWIVAYWHHPPYSKGSHDSDGSPDLTAIRESVLPVLEDFGVDLVLTGHSHSYERSVLVDGHYGTSDTYDPAHHAVDSGDGQSFSGGPYVKPDGASSHQGTVYAVSGSSGRVGGGTLDHPVMEVSVAALGSFVLDVQGKVLEGRFVDTRGRVLDRFTIAKCAEPDLALTDVTVEGPREEERCHAIAAGPGVVVTPAGSLTLRAGKRVVLRDGFSVAAGGRLSVVIDPALTHPP